MRKINPGIFLREMPAMSPLFVYSKFLQAGTTMQGYFKKEKSQKESDKDESEVIVFQRVRNNW